MTLDLNALRAMRKTSSNTLAKITAEMEKQETSGGKRDDENLWRCTTDKAGNGSAVLRFLPAIGETDLPWAKVYDHGFKGPSGKWYIEKCLTTIGQADPVAEHCASLWNSGVEKDKEIARERKRRLSYYANVLVIRDPGNPANEGKVLIYKFGKKIFDKIKDKLNPVFEDEKAVDVFNPWEGANFRLRVRKVEGYTNYDKSEFDSVSAISDDDEEILNVLNKRHDLNEFTNPKNFKSYDELSKKLADVLNGSSAGSAKAADFILEDEPRSIPAPAPSRSIDNEPKVTVGKSVAQTSDDDDDGMAFFKDLIND